MTPRISSNNAVVIQVNFQTGVYALHNSLTLLRAEQYQALGRREDRCFPVLSQETSQFLVCE
jgi:hypothetical protein